MKHLLLLGLMLLSNNLLAAPIYLDCSVVKADRTAHYKVSLDEIAGTAVISNQTASSRVPAIFAQDSVNFNSRVISGTVIVAQYRIDRTTLAFAETITYMRSVTFTGSCVIAKPIERKI